jgi:hypothetical protein
VLVFYRATSLDHRATYLEALPPRRADHEDVVVIFLKSFPPGVDPDIVPEWRIPSNDPPLRGAMIGGLSLSSSVGGSGCEYTGGAGTYTFVKDSGEPGNSGALMYNLCPPAGGDPSIIGVYLGFHHIIAPRMKERGRICPLPLLSKFLVYQRAVPPATSKFQLSSAQRVIR